MHYVQSRELMRQDLAAKRFLLMLGSVIEVFLPIHNHLTCAPGGVEAPKHVPQKAREVPNG